MIRYSNARKALYSGTFFSFALAFAVAVFGARVFCDFTLYLDCFYNRVFWAQVAVFFPFCFPYFYLIFLLIFSSTTLPFDSSDPERMLNRVLFSVWFFLVFSLAGFLLLVPAGNAIKKQAAFRSSVAVDSLSKMTEAFREKSYAEALNFLGIYESIDESSDARFSSLDENITFILVHRNQDAALLGKEYWLNSENLRHEIESLLRRQAEPPMKSSENDYALKKLAFEKYSFGRENHYYQPIAEAYKIFRYLSATSPDDEEIELHMKRAEEEIHRHVLVKDRINEERIFPLSHNICFVNADNETLRQTIYARKLILLTGRDLIESVEVKTEYRDGRKSILEAEFGRVEDDRILFDSVYLENPTEVIGGRFTEGGRDEWIDEHSVALGFSGHLLPMFDSENRDLSTVPFFDLIRIRNRFPNESEIAAVYETEIIVRLTRLLLVVLAPIFMLVCGFRMAPKEIKSAYLFLPVILAVSFFFYAVYWVGRLTAVACLSFASFETLLIAVPATAAVALVFLVCLFIASYSNRMM